MQLDFTPGLTVRYPTLRDMMIAVVYGGSPMTLRDIAAACDLSASELTRMLNHAQHEPRHLDAETMVKIIETTGDARPVQWLIERFLRDPNERRASALAQLVSVMPSLIALAKEAGAPAPVKRKSR